MATSSLVSWTGGLLAALFACSFSSGGVVEKPSGRGGSPAGFDPTSSFPPVSEVDLPARMAEATCVGIGHCCTDMGYSYRLDRCSEIVKADYQDFINAVQGRDVKYDPEAAGRCAAALEHFAPQCVVSTSEAELINSSCSAIWTGSKAAGEVCGVSLECAGANNGMSTCRSAGSADADGGNATTTCTPTGVALGGHCSQTCSAVGPDWVCVFPSNSAVPPELNGPSCLIEDGRYCSNALRCTALQEEGKACSETIQCVVSAFCDGKECKPKVPAGEGCTQSDMCENATYCDPILNRCRPRKGAGARCERDEECEEDSCISSTCSFAWTIASDLLCQGDR